MKIKNWGKFQHFKDRRPPWVKLYRDILDDPDWHDLDPVDAKLLVMLWLVASEDKNMEGTLPCPRKLAFRLRVSERELIQSLNRMSNWVIQEDIKAISEQYQGDAPETETETELETELETETTLSPAEPLTESEPIKIPPCPHLKIVGEYNKILSHKLPSVNPKLWTDSRRKPLTSRWKEVAERQNLTWWTNYFETVASSPFLIGGKTDWRANLDWLIKQANMIKVLEGKYRDNGSTNKTYAPKNIREANAMRKEDMCDALLGGGDNESSQLITG